MKNLKTFKKFFESATVEDVQKIIDGIHQISMTFENYHHNTLSTSRHKSIDQVQEMFNDLKDDLIEKIIGYTGFRYNKTTISPIEYSIESLMNFPKVIMSFADELESFGKDNGYTDIENIAQEISGIGAKLSYLLTLNDNNEK